MTINETMFTLMDKKNIKYIDLANHLNVNKTVVSNWKSRGNNPPADYIVPICELLNISVYELLGAEEKKLTDQEQLLLEQFRKCSDGNKQILLTAASGLSNQERKEEINSSALKIG